MEAFCEFATHTRQRVEALHNEVFVVFCLGLFLPIVAVVVTFLCLPHCLPDWLPASLCGTTNKATYTWLKSTVAKKFKIYFVLSEHTQRKKKKFD